MATKWVRVDEETHRTLQRVSKERKATIKETIAFLVDVGERRQKALARYRKAP